MQCFERKLGLFRRRFLQHLFISATVNLLVNTPLEIAFRMPFTRRDFRINQILIIFNSALVLPYIFKKYTPVFKDPKSMICVVLTATPDSMTLPETSKIL